MTRARSFFVLVALASCWTAEKGNHQHATLGDIAYDIPSDWRCVSKGRLISECTPPENTRKESVSVIRADLNPELARAGSTAIGKFLVDAQGSLRAAHVSGVEYVSTPQGLHGFRVAVEFSPPHMKARYTRVHTLLVDGTTLIHVLYTAASPNSQSEAMQLVLDSAHKES